jgi:hypothetical protein
MASSTGRSILGGVVGVVSASVTVYAIEDVGHRVYPVPAGLDFSNMDAMREYMAGLGFAPIAFVLAAWVIGTFVGGVVGIRIAPTRPVLMAGVVAGVILLGAVFNLVAIPHPLWMVLGTGILVPAAAVAAVATTPRPRR